MKEKKSKFSHTIVYLMMNCIQSFVRKMWLFQKATFLWLFQKITKLRFINVISAEVFFRINFQSAFPENSMQQAQCLMYLFACVPYVYHMFWILDITMQIMKAGISHLLLLQENSGFKQNPAWRTPHLLCKYFDCICRSVI